LPQIKCPVCGHPVLANGFKDSKQIAQQIRMATQDHDDDPDMDDATQVD